MRPYSFFNIIVLPKKDKMRLDFPVTECKLCFGNGFPSRNPVSVFILSVISAKDDVNPPSFKMCSFASRHRNTSKDYCVLSCWAFLCRSGSGFLAEPTSSHGDTSGFFVSSRLLPTSFFQNNAETVRYDQNVVPPVLSFNIHLSRYPFFEETDQEKTYPITRNTGDTDNEQTKQRDLN